MLKARADAWWILLGCACGLFVSCSIGNVMEVQKDVRRVFSSRGMLRGQGYFYHDTLYFSELLMGAPQQPYGGRPDLRVLLNDQDTLRLDTLTVSGLQRAMPELLFPPLKDTFYIEKFPFRHKVKYQTGGKPRQYLGWDTDSVRIFADDCQGISFVVWGQRLVSVFIRPSQKGMPGWEARSEGLRKQCESRRISPVRISCGPGKPFLPLPLTEEEWIYLFGQPERVVDDFDMRRLY